jgi:hypothetical protein
MRDRIPFLRLRKKIDEIEDPEAATVVRRLADLQELDLQRRTLPPGTPERDSLAGRIDDRARGILDDHVRPEDEPE